MAVVRTRQASYVLCAELVAELTDVLRLVLNEINTSLDLSLKYALG